MRSGFLNASPADMPASSSSSQDKGSRNKRKFRTDQQVSLPLPTPACNDGDQNEIETSLPFYDVTVGAVSVDSTGCRAEACRAAWDHLNARSLTSPGNLHLLQYGIPPTGCPSAFQHYPYPKADVEYELHEPDWDQYSEAQLEQILIGMLDILYNDAVKRISSCDHSQEEALSAVLRNGRWTGRDALTSIVENSLAWLQGGDTRGEITEIGFSNLKEMERYFLTEMVCMLRKVRPFLSRGDAMWCLLMCDMNVLLACAMDGDAMQSSLRVGTSPPVVAQSKIIPCPSLPAGIVNGVPFPQQNPRVRQAGIQPLNPLVSPHKENRSAFSTPSFSSSPIGKVAIACRKENSGKTGVPSIAHWPPEIRSCDSEITSQEREMQMVNNVNADHLAAPSHIAMADDQATELGLFMSKCVNGNYNLEKAHSLNPGPLDNAMETCREMPTAGVQCFPQCFESSARSTVTAQCPSFQPDLAAGKMKQSSNYRSFSQLSMVSDGKHLVQTDLQIGNTHLSPGFQLSPSEVWMNLNASGNVTSVTSSRGADLPLATTPPVNGVTETVPHTNGKEESPSTDPELSHSINRILGCIDSESEDRKTDMLWQLADRIKDLECQLQEWTDWAQQKVMQAARRLTKDSTELKALRQEREEYLRLKREKQVLEESTKKKLSEMEVSLRKALSQVDRANSTARRLETENSEVRAEMEAAKLTATESITVCQEVTKREKKSVKKVQGWEKQKLKLQQDLADEKGKLSSLIEQAQQARERQQQAEVRWRQEKTAKEEALVHADSKEKAKEEAEHFAKRREDALHRKSETESQGFRDELQKLESEIAQVKLSLGIQPPMIWGNEFGINSNNLDSCSVQKLQQMNAGLLSEIAELNESQRDVHHERECVICMNEEMSVVFLPCAHQILCAKCNDAHERQGVKDCLFCRTPIHQRIRVYGVRS